VFEIKEHASLPPYQDEIRGTNDLDPALSPGLIAKPRRERH
jgi:hypothetical protein